MTRLFPCTMRRPLVLAPRRAWMSSRDRVTDPFKQTRDSGDCRERSRITVNAVCSKGTFHTDRAQESREDCELPCTAKPTDHCGRTSSCGATPGSKNYLTHTQMLKLEGGAESSSAFHDQLGVVAHHDKWDPGWASGEREKAGCTCATRMKHKLLTQTKMLKLEGGRRKLIMAFHDELGHLPVVAQHDGWDPRKMGCRCGRHKKRHHLCCATNA